MLIIRIILITYCLLAGVIPASSQYGFNKAFAVDEISRLDIDDILWDGDGIILRGNRLVDSAYWRALFICKLDTNGQVVWHKTIYNADGNDDLVSITPTRFIKTKDGGFLLPVTTFFRGTLGLYKVDSIGNLIFGKEYQNNEFTIFPNSVVELDNAFYVSGTHQRSNYYPDAFVLKTDLNGDRIWLKYFGADTLQEYNAGMVVVSDTSFTLGCQIRPPGYQNLPFSDRWRQPWLLTLDTAGNVIHEWIGSPNDFRAKGGQGIVHTPQGAWGMLYSEFMEIDQLTVYSKPTISVLDSNYNLIWKHSLGEFTSPANTYFDLVFDTITKEYILCGQLGIDNILTGCVTKFSEDGKLQWSVFGTNSAQISGTHWLGGVCVSSTGSVFSAGYIEQTNPDYQTVGWILKVTPDGCIDTLCTTSSILEQIQAVKKLNVYPNPVTDQINVEFQNPGIGTITTTIYNVFGNLVMSTRDFISELIDDRIRLQLSMILLPPGTYFMRIRQDDQEIAIVKVVKI